MQSTFNPSKKTFKSQWFIVDATDKCLGRLSTEVAKILIGKNKAFYTPSQKLGDCVIVINADKVKVSGKKFTQKIYFRHSGFLGGQTIEKFSDLQKRLPQKIIEKSIKGMLPKNRLGRHLFTKLKVFRGSNYIHQAQKPQTLIIDNIRK